ncbi:AraC family transcriptional regulator [Paenibacillus hodogayensis]|uniref:AraC family transcriptional regulator n=1 Tax=Paenibacillus hodogayensis TaxID=279208 RepID=A0ABV5W517_9BACL
MNTIFNAGTRLYRLAEVCAVGLSVGSNPFEATGGGDVAIIVLKGSGMLDFGEGARAASRGEVWLLTSDRPFRLWADRQPFEGCLVRYEVYGETKLHRYERVTAEEVRMIAPDFAPLLRCCSELMKLEEGEQDGFRGQAGLYRLLELLAAAERRPGPEETTEAAIARVVRYMEQHLERDLPRDELAQMAGLSPGYFSAAFLRYKGESPSDYMLGLRLERAEELLFLHGTVKEAAARVGFEDEFYFSRRFKQKKGLPPSAYIRSRSFSIASVSEPLSGNLLALRLRPRAAAFYEHHDEYGTMLRLHSCEEGEGPVWAHNLLMLEQASPELIFCTDCLHEGARAELERIAPTIPIGWLGDDWRRQLQQMAKAVERAGEAEAWLAAYDRKAESASRRVRRKWGGATVQVWRIMDAEFRVYGRRNAGAVLYEDLRLGVDDRLKPIEIFETVTRDELFRYDADMLVVMIDPTPQAAIQWERLQRSEAWTRLSAIRQWRVYPTGTEKLLEYSAWSHSRALDHLTAILL